MRHWFCIRHLARALKCGPIRLEQTLASLLTAGAIASILLWHPLAFSPGILAFIQAPFVWLYEPVRQAVRLHVLMADLAAKIRTGMDFPVEDSIAGWVWQHQQPLRCRR